MGEHEKVRLDRWLWAARFYKTRAQAKTAIEGGKVQFHPTAEETTNTSNQVRPKVSKEVGIGDMLSVRRSPTQTIVQTVVITGLSEKRGNATAAATLYRETDHSIEARETERSRQAMQRVGLTVPRSKPSKRDRRVLQKFKQDSSTQ
ncbi:MAG: S4 domain-containing protein [Gammaproteobacteria bacterium]|nr:S4 domain-containing protein [Gammaproteobacteria bacterium]